MRLIFHTVCGEMNMRTHIYREDLIKIHHTYLEKGLILGDYSLVEQWDISEKSK